MSKVDSFTRPSISPHQVALKPKPPHSDTTSLTAHSFNSAAQGHAKLGLLADRTTARSNTPPPLPPRPRTDTSYRNAHFQAASEKFSLRQANATDRRDGTSLPGMKGGGADHAGSAEFHKSSAPATTHAQARTSTLNPRKQLNKMLQRGTQAFSRLASNGPVANMARTLNQAARAAHQTAETAWNHAQVTGQHLQETGRTMYKEVRAEYEAEITRQSERANAGAHNGWQPTQQAESTFHPEYRAAYEAQGATAGTKAAGAEAAGAGAAGAGAAGANLGDHGVLNAYAAKYGLTPLEANASPAEEKALYKKLALKMHPDKGGDAAAFQEMSVAHENLVAKIPSTYEGPGMTDAEQRDAAEAAWVRQSYGY